MDDFDLEVLIHQAAALWATIQASAVWALVVGVVTVIVALTKVIIWAFSKVRDGRESRIATDLAATTHVQSFADEEIRAAVRYYVEPDCSNVDPSNESDIRHFVGVREQVFAVMDRALALDGKQHLLVLADSGMGKTTFLLNFFAREQRRAKKSRRPMAIVPLGRADAVEQIKAVQDKRSTLLLLDALDEDTSAIRNHRTRLDELMRVSGDFKALILTCRTQFFSDDDDIPRETGILRVTPRRAGTTASHEFRKVYLLPFTEGQVQRYVRHVIPWWRPFRRVRATSIVHKIPELSVRPMLLALLPELISERSEMNELWQLYEFMVDSWLVRESNWIDPELLKRLSMDIAVDLVVNRDIRGGERISPTELSKNLELASGEVEQWKLTTRSLLNRDAAGNYKFAHRSIMEFLFIKALIEGDNTCASLAWTDMMCDLFLSWGRVATTVADLKEVDRLLLRTDLSHTTLFPIAASDESASSIDANWAKSALSQTGSARNRAGIPPAWRSRTSRCLVKAGMVSVYEFAEGIVWKFSDTKGIEEYEEQTVYKDDLSKRRLIVRDWQDPSLSEFHSLVQTLVALQTHELDTRDLYWLADEDQMSIAVARVRWGSKGGETDTLEQTPSVDFPGGVEFIYSSLSIKTLSSDYIIDVYKVPKVRVDVGSGIKAPPMRALRIRAIHGDAQKLWQHDNQSS